MLVTEVGSQGMQPVPVTAAYLKQGTKFESMKLLTFTTRKKGGLAQIFARVCLPQKSHNCSYLCPGEVAVQSREQTFLKVAHDRAGDPLREGVMFPQDAQQLLVGLGILKRKMWRK